MNKIVVTMLLGALFISCGLVNAAEGTGLVEKFVSQQLDQLEAGCKTELDTYCKDVTPGEGRRLACIYSHSDKLSSKCEKAKYDSAQDFSVAAAALNAFAEACQADMAKLCSTVELGEGRILKCLEENKAKVSAPCNEARQKYQGGVLPKQGGPQ